MKRLEAITYLRVLAMMMVMFYHCICCYGIWQGKFSAGVEVRLWFVLEKCLSSIHVPLFLLISGFLYTFKRLDGSYDNTLDYLKSRFVRIGVPYLFWGIVFACMTLYSWHSLVTGMAHLWFLMVLFECCLIGRFLDRLWLNKYGVLAMGAMCVCYLILVPFMPYFTDMFCMDTLIRYLPYYLVGCCLGTQNWLLKSSNSSKKRDWLLLFLSFCIFIVANTRYLWCIRPLVSTFFISALSFICLRYIHVVSDKITSLAECSMGMYILHQPIIQLVGLVPVVSVFRVNHYYLYPLLLFCVLMPLVWEGVRMLRRCSLFRMLLG